MGNVLLIAKTQKVGKFHRLCCVFIYNPQWLLKNVYVFVLIASNNDRRVGESLFISDVMCELLEALNFSAFNQLMCMEQFKPSTNFHSWLNYKLNPNITDEQHTQVSYNNKVDLF